MQTFQEFMATFPDEAACRTYVTMRRWPDGPHCPRCDNTKLYECGPTRPFHWQCMNCGKTKRTPYRFSVLVGTVFENTNVPLVTWFKVLYTMLQSKKGISSRQIRRMFFGETSSLHTAWYICHRLRAGMRDGDFKQLMGIVEVDETFLGGKQKNRHWKERQKFSGGGSANTGKTTVIGAISRKGNVVCKIIEDTSAETLSRFVEEAVSDKVSLVATDEFSGYTDLGHFYQHKIISHRAQEYVRGNVHTNNIESFWALLKRGIIGTYHNVSKKYLPLYLNEFQFRQNNRKNEDIFGEAIAGC
jgi:transposase-like protein